MTGKKKLEAKLASTDHKLNLTLVKLFSKEKGIDIYKILAPKDLDIHQKTEQDFARKRTKKSKKGAIKSARQVVRQLSRIP